MKEVEKIKFFCREFSSEKSSKFLGIELSDIFEYKFSCSKIFFKISVLVDLFDSIYLNFKKKFYCKITSLNFAGYMFKLSGFSLVDLFSFEFLLGKS